MSIQIYGSSMQVKKDISAVEARQRWMGILARAEAEELDHCWQRLKRSEALPDYQMLRRPEIGLTLLRGRIGGDGPAFNVGEMTVTRCSVRLADSTVGHAWIAGRRLIQAEQAAVIDAILQRTPDHAVLAEELARLERAFRQRRLTRSKKAAATRVDFFTLVRGAT